MVNADRSMFMTVRKLAKEVMTIRDKSRSLCKTAKMALAISDLAKSATPFLSRRANISK